MATIKRLTNSFLNTVSSFIRNLLYLLELLLFLRFILKFFRANPENMIVRLIDNYSSIFVRPFDFIFYDISWQGYFIETSTVSAMIAYAFIVYLIFTIFGLNHRRS